LGYPARVAILQHLFKINSCICGDLVLEIGLAQPTISQHLKILKSLGLIKGNVEGTRFKPTKLLLNSFKLK
jgi:DNA-binding transcriptional ArsR family regulator